MTDTPTSEPVPTPDESPLDQAYDAYLKAGHTDSKTVKDAFSAGFQAGSEASPSGGSEVPPDLNR